MGTDDRVNRLAQTLVDASPDALIAMSAEGAVSFWSAGAERIFGYTRDEAVGRSIFDLIVPADRIDETRSALAATLQSGTSSYESVRRTKDGSLILVDVANRRARDTE